MIAPIDLMLANSPHFLGFLGVSFSFFCLFAFLLRFHRKRSIGSSKSRQFLTPSWVHDQSVLAIVKFTFRHMMLVKITMGFSTGARRREKEKCFLYQTKIDHLP